ncbi:hypothetical protein WUBG_09774 [Wuchereria bancrofti]|uniref:Uncharacterized protein n=1 Tax=Wuchereria bancrofti TaxID=6293 RepID=J9EAC4_WUCBA|nr:hypothetical protein WUBG_09774 [Wuchereria bancrofti]
MDRTKTFDDRNSLDDLSSPIHSLRISTYLETTHPVSMNHPLLLLILLKFILLDCGDLALISLSWATTAHCNALQTNIKIKFSYNHTICTNIRYYANSNRCD